MRADLLLSQPNTGRKVSLALKATAAAAALYGVLAGLLYWNLNMTLQREQASLKTTRRRALDERAARRQKRTAAAQMDRINVSAPSSNGSAEFTEELYRLASASGTRMIGVLFPTSGPVAPPPPAQPVVSDGVTPANGAKPNAPAAADPNSDDGWNRARFECNLTGSFPALEDFLDRMARLPRVVEISGIELHREPVDAHTGAVRVHLKLTGSFFGQDGKP